MRVRLSTREYTNWIKAGQCLCLLARGLQPLIDREMSHFHHTLLNQNTLLRRPCERHCRPTGNKLLGACRCCLEWQRTIQDHHRQPQHTVNWDNCSPVSWRTNHWEVAKAFMPRGQGNIKTADQFDAAALLNLINSCDWFQSVDPKPVKEVIRYRNELMHSSDFLVSDTWINNFDSTLRRFMLHFRDDASMAQTEKQINQMLQADLSIHIHLWDQTDSNDLVADGINADSISADVIVQWEAELLQQRLQVLLEETDESSTLSAEQLKGLDSFFESNKDLGERFSSQLQNMNLLRKK
uniref:DZIP3-like HEPN domain-containing protein n=1 Tax=Knipowitschia caucasica TaxID=637954 RepID=A0AAV2JRA2_KNICA